MSFKKLSLAIAMALLAVSAILAKSDITFTLSKDTIETGARVKVLFNKPLPLVEDEQYWITIAPAETPDSWWGEWQYVKAGATQVKLKSVWKAGKYEVRLHARYPIKQFHVIYRLPIKVVK
ncbi:MAG: hypothetical protein OEZ22_14830 [Spirochaetia bacterium]|nr:hypothetical protein [Spirochaetia bacterium]